MSDEHSAAKMAAGAAAVAMAFVAVGTAGRSQRLPAGQPLRLGAVPQAPDPPRGAARPARPRR